MYKVFRLSKIIIIIFGLSLSPLVAQEFAGGSGTENDPWQVANVNHLNNLHNYTGTGHADKHFIQTADIDLNTSPWNSSPGWNPIGGTYSSVAFNGSFDGAGYTISNLYIEDSETNYLGLFAAVSNANLKNITLVDFNITGQNYLGPLTGYSTNSSIFNCHSSGEINSQERAGLLIGSTYNSQLTFCSSQGSSAGTNYVGGLAGYNSGGSVYYSYSNADITGNNEVGGIIGYVIDGELVDSYSHSTVSGIEKVGGLVGYLSGSNAIISRSLSTGTVEGQADVGGLLGSNNSGSVYYSYWDTQSSGEANSAGGTGLTTNQMQNQASFSNFNFNQVWAFSGPDTYPNFQDLTVYSPLTQVSLSDLTGAGTEEFPYQITTASELDAIRQDYYAHYELMNDIDMTSSVIWNQGQGFETIGAGTSNHFFRGTFNGNDFTITGLVINKPGEDYQGLFAYLSGAEIKNLRIAGFNVHGSNNVGGLTGYSASGSSIYNCHTSGEVLGQNYLGGMAGQVNYSSILYSSSNSNVVGEDEVGALVGSINQTSLYYSHSNGDITGYENVGGLTGYVYNGQVVDCFSHASVNANNSVGGLVGYLWGNASVISRSLSTGTVEGQADIGGLLGSNSSGNVYYSYWDTQTSGQTNSIAGIGLTTNQMQNHTTYRNFNFNQVWTFAGVSSYPEIQDLTIYTPMDQVSLAELTGNGTEVFPYQITTASELDAIRQDYYAHYELMNDIDMTSSVIWNMGLGFTPIGRYNSSHFFRGSFDGNGFTISGLVVNNPNNDYQALFGYGYDALIENVNLADANVLGKNYVSAVIAYAASGTGMNSCNITGVISGQNYLGLLAGQISGSIANLCSAQGDLLGYDYVGGLVGRATTSSTINESYTDIAIKGADKVGGLLGYLNSSFVYDSFSHSQTTGIEDVGGLIGDVFSSNSRVYRCYSTGLVTGSNETGGMIGSGTTAEDMYLYNYFNGETSGQIGSVGSYARTTAQMTYPYENTYYVYDFINKWMADEDYFYNSGYPYLQSFVELPEQDIYPTISQLNATTVRIEWDAVPGVTTYKVLRADSPLANDDPGWLELGITSNLQYDTQANSNRAFFRVIIND